MPSNDHEAAIFAYRPSMPLAGVAVSGEFTRLRRQMAAW